MRKIHKGRLAPAGLLIIFTFCLHSVLFTSAAAKENWEGTGSRPLKVGYCQGEEYYEFNYQLYYLVNALVENGCFKYDMDSGINEEMPAREIWEHISGSGGEGSRVEFVRDAFADLTDSEYSGPNAGSVKEKLTQLAEDNGVDIMLTMGTTAGLQVKSAGVPSMNFVSADAVGAGITGGKEYSEDDSVWAHVDSESFARSLSVMDDIFSPKSVGIVYANNVDAYFYSGADNVMTLAGNSGFRMEKEYVNDSFDEKDYPVYLENMRKAHEKLAEKQVDVFIMTTSLLAPEDFEYVLQPFVEKNIPTYSINSVEDVKNGVMLAVESSDYENIGRFGAENILRYMEGSKLSSLPQEYATAPYLVINYKAAKEIGYTFPFDMLLTANVIFNQA